MTTRISRINSVPEVAHTQLLVQDDSQLGSDPSAPSAPLCQDQHYIPENRSETALINVKLRNVWEELMKGLGSTGVPKKKAAVLMVSWDESIDDMDTSPEVEALGRLFEEKFQYTVIKRKLTKTRPANQINKYLSSFVAKYDDESTLLIVYYAGHGTRGNPGELHLAGRINDGDSADYLSSRNSIPWHQTEFLLKNVIADVLLIFDCCFAGNLAPAIQGRGRMWPTRSFEYLAACPYNKLTHPPGRKSFTTALIWALETLLENRGRFTTHELQQKIMKEAPHFPRDQVVEVQERGQPCDQRLVLAPLNDPSDSEDGSAASDRHIPLRNFIDLRVWYPTAPNEEDVGDFASILRRVIVDGKISANNIAWVRFDHVDPVVRKAVSKWQTLLSPDSIRKLKSTSANLRTAIPPILGVNSHLQPPHTPSPSDSSSRSNQGSQIQESQSEEGYLSMFPGSLERPENIMEVPKRLSDNSTETSENDRDIGRSANTLRINDWIKSLTAWVWQPASLVTFAAVYICVDHLVLRRSRYRPA